MTVVTFQLVCDLLERSCGSQDESFNVSGECFHGSKMQEGRVAIGEEGKAIFG